MTVIIIDNIEYDVPEPVARQIEEYRLICSNMTPLQLEFALHEIREAVENIKMERDLYKEQILLLDNTL